MTEREKIPEPIKRLVRQQCNFGCAICGMPIFEYDHIIPYSQVLKHEVDNLILLCPNHHSAKGKQLDPERIAEAKKNPFNVGKMIIEGFKFEPNRKLEIKIGSNTVNKQFTDFAQDYSCLWVNGISFFTIHFINEWTTMSFSVTDGIGQIVLTVEYGELKFAANIWDYKYEGSNIQIRTKQREIILDINLSNFKVEILRGCFIHFPYKDGFVVQPDGSLLTISEDKVPRIQIGGNYSNNGIGGIGFWNKSKFPNVTHVGGFGSFLTL